MRNARVIEISRRVLFVFLFTQLCSLKSQQGLLQPENPIVNPADTAQLSGIRICEQPAQAVDAGIIDQRPQQTNIIMLALLILMIKRHRQPCAGLSLARLVNDPKGGRLGLPAIAASHDLPMCAIKDKLIGVLKVSSATMATHRAFKLAALSPYAIQFVFIVIVGKKAEGNPAAPISLLVVASELTPIVPLMRIAFVFKDIGHAPVLVITVQGVVAAAGGKSRYRSRGKELSLGRVASFESWIGKIRRNTEIAAIRIAAGVEVDI